MSIEIENKLGKIPIIKQLVMLSKSIKLPWLHGLSLYDLLELYIIGIVEGAVSYRAAAIAFSFFMALFPFALFILNLIPYIPLKGFQDDFMVFVHQSLPPTTFDAVSKILNDILHNSHSGLLSTGFFIAIFLMANGVNAILGGFENSHHVTLKRKYISQYLIALALSIVLSFILIITVAAIVIFEVFIQKTKIQDVLSEKIPLIEMGRYAFVIVMILITTSILFKFGTKEERKRSLISIGSVFTTVLTIITSYFFGIWVVKFSKYNELYGSIGTLLIVMFFIWINSMILLLGFELNATINRLRIQEQNNNDVNRPYMNYKKLLVVLIISITQFSFSQSVTGKWKTIDDETGKENGIVEIYENSGKIYGRIINILKSENRFKKCKFCPGSDKDKPIMGLTFIKGLIKDGKEYNGGKILDPKNGKLYNCYINLIGNDTLKVRGYIGISLFGRTQYWYRVID